MSPKGVFLLDIEVELAWGIIDERINREKVKSAARKARMYLDYIFSVLDKHNIPVTWGIVGHVILDRCERISGIPHPEMPRPSYRWLKKDWYAEDPCKELNEEPAFYGRDIVDEIIKHVQRKKFGDIACHSFSHQLFGDPDLTEVVAEAEVKRCVSLLKETYNMAPQVFIFPRDYPGHLDVLRRNGVIAYRGRIPHMFDYQESGEGIWNSARRYLSLATYFASFYLTIPPPVVSLSVKNALVNIPGSLCYNKKPFIPLGLVVKKALSGIDRAIKKRKVFHLYTHLINFGAAPDIKEFFEGFEKIIAYVDLCREKNELEVMTMKRLAERYLQEIRTIG